MVVLIAELGLTGVLTFALMFGFAPGFVLRLLVLIYPKNDPRRQELVAELYTLGRVERLLFVGEQLETALFEGGRSRVAEMRRARTKSPEPERPESARATGRTYTVVSVESRIERALQTWVAHLEPETATQSRVDEATKFDLVWPTARVGVYFDYDNGAGSD